MRTLLATLLFLVALPASADNWRLLDGSTFNFTSTFEGTALPGRFGRFDVVLEFDPQELAAGQLQVNVDLAAADMDDPDMNAAISGPEWFHVDGFPQAVYKSSDIVADAAGHFVAHGELLLKGIRRSVDVPFTWTGDGDFADMHGELTLNRRDFDVGSGEWSSGEQIGIEVKLKFALRLERGE